jgi:hypothetical protein
MLVLSLARVTLQEKKIIYRGMLTNLDNLFFETKSVERFQVGKVITDGLGHSARR